MDHLPVAGAIRTLIWVYAGVFGALVGSFLNVVIARVPAGQSIVRPRSRCPKCETPIAWYDNVPLVSWVVLGAKCRKCKQPIAPRYPLVELLTGVLSLAVLRHFGLWPHWLPVFTFTALLVALTFIDLDHWLLPHALTWPGIALGLIYNGTLGRVPFWEALGGAIGGFLVLFLFDELFYRLTGKEGIGEGDFFLFAMIGAWLGARALPLSISLAAIQGAVIGIAFLAFGKKVGKHEAATPHPRPPLQGGAGEQERGVARAEGGPGGEWSETAGTSPRQDPEPADAWKPTPHHVPFGPFLALGALETMFFGPAIVAWYFDALQRLVAPGM